MNPTTPNYSNAPVGSQQRSNDLLRASNQLLNSTPGIQSTVPNNLPISTTISAPSIANNQPVNIPFYNQPNTTDNLSSSVTNTLSKANTDANATSPTATIGSTNNLLQEAMKQYTTGISTQASDISKINSDAQLLDKKRAATELANSITQYDKEYRDQVQQLKQNFQGTTGGLQSELNALQDRYQNTRANMALSYQVANNDYQGAQDTAQQKIQSLKDTNAGYLDSYKAQVFAVQNSMTPLELKQADSQIRIKEANYKSVADAYSAIIQNAINNKAPSSVLNALDQASRKPGATQADLYSAAGSYGISPNSQIVQLDNGQTVVVDKNTGKVITNIGGSKGQTPVSLTGLTTEQAADPFIQKMAKTVGGKPITDAFAQKLNKGLTVLDQIGGLQTNIANTDTGPLVGLFRGKNPWDTNAQVIKAQLNAIVPNLARGVYGEVGVLTDNDIAQYSKTLPNLTSPADVRNAVLGITVDLIGKSIKQTLEVNAANQKDVSGFIDIYTQMQSTKNSILEQIPGYKGSSSASPTIAKNGDTKVYDKVTYKVINGIWTPQ